MYPQVPTAKQTVEFFLVCVRLSNVLQPINIVRTYAHSMNYRHSWRLGGSIN
ncbi:DUF6888 family protein [Nostoc sp.]|uniref:DUF6888 family protein n=1 Tax=Nostoc sp. TaxID=1180 RepID=UPI003FA5F8FC